MFKKNLEQLMRQLKYEFKDKSLLKQALTHRSAALENNERLEFLGDAILSFVITQALFEKFPQQSEGSLSRLRASLVKGDVLAEIALDINLGHFLYLGQGELRSGGFRRASILADGLEAMIAAIFLDGGFLPSQQFILNLYHSRLNDECLIQVTKDSKTQLQEFLQARKKATPEYQLVNVDGEEHEQVFHVQCKVSGLTATGCGATRRKAEQQAAQSLLTLLEKEINKI